MKGICKENTAQNLDLNEATSIPNQEHTFPLTIGKEYLIMAIGVYKDTNYLYYLVDDEHTPFWIPYELFKISDEAFPPNWHINVIDKTKYSERTRYFLSGFYELCTDENFYDALAHGESKALDTYWKRKKEFQQWYVEREAGRKLYQKEAKVYYSINDQELLPIKETIAIRYSETSIDIEKLKKIIVDKWKSNVLYEFYYDQGNRGENLYNIISNELSNYASDLAKEKTCDAQKKLNRPDIRLNWYDNYPKSDVRSIGFEVLLLLAEVGWGTPIEELTTDDIPMILEFLDTPPGKSLEAWEKWEKYWANLDYPARRKKLLES